MGDVLRGVSAAAGALWTGWIRPKLAGAIITALCERTAHCYLDTRYRARTWARPRRVVIKAEVVQLTGHPPRDNPRYVVTSLRQTPRFVYEKVYCRRGDIENRIKALHDGLQLDRTSCSTFWANQLRVLLTAAAYGSAQKQLSRSGCSIAVEAQPSRTPLSSEFSPLTSTLVGF